MMGIDRVLFSTGSLISMHAQTFEFQPGDLGRLLDDGLAMCAPPRSLFVGMSASVHRRRAARHILSHVGSHWNTLEILGSHFQILATCEVSFNFSNIFSILYSWERKVDDDPLTIVNP